VKALAALFWAIGFALTVVAGCAPPLDAPSAFEDEEYLCDPAHAAQWQQRIGDCRAAYQRDGSCPGVISFRGLVEAQSVVIDSPVTKVNFTDIPRGDGTIDRAYFIFGASPYFLFSYDLQQFDAPPGMSRSGIFVADPCTTVNTMCFSAILNIEARGGTALLRMSTLVRNVLIETPQELEITFAGDLDRGGNVAGCFDLNLAPSP
jgi:hypothetical protein